MASENPPGVDVQLDWDTVSASAVVNASPNTVFEYLRRPANHADIGGDGSVRGTTGGAEVLGPGDRFGMSMKMGVPYRIKSKVVEYEPDRRIAWCHLVGHRWRWEVEPAGDGSSRVTETFDMSTAKLSSALRMAGFPGKHQANVANSVAKLAAHFASGGA